MKVHVIVQQGPMVRPCWERTRASIEASDIGTRYTVMSHAPDVTRQAHLVRVLATLRDSDAEWGLRLEDDVLVNRRILANLASWPNLPNVDVGWLFSYGQGTSILGSMAVLFRRSVMRGLVENLRSLFRHRPFEYQDPAIVAASLETRARLVVHDPPLVEHIGDKSTVCDFDLSHPTRTTNGRFDPEWLRA